MLKWVIWLLVLANVGYWGWTQGHLAAVGLAPHEQREPQRLQAQIRPNAVRLLNAPRVGPTPPVQATAPAVNAPVSVPINVPISATVNAATAGNPVSATAAPAPTTERAPPPQRRPEPSAADARACWQAGSFTLAQADRLRTALTRLDMPRGTWRLNESRSGGRWMVYMGRYADAAQVERKKAELRQLNVTHREVSAAGMRPGLSLGSFATEAAAEQALQSAVRAGVRTARVVVERPESIDVGLRLPYATPAQRDAVAGLGSVLVGRSLRSCN
jgi:cell division protein FtsN